MTRIRHFESNCVLPITIFKSYLIKLSEILNIVQKQKIVLSLMYNK